MISVINKILWKTDKDTSTEKKIAFLPARNFEKENPFL